jgi:hypothetical protein
VLGLVVGLATLTFAMRATGPLMPRLPSALTDRTAGLAPALIAALVATQLTSASGVLRLDVKALAVLVAAVLSALRVPLVVCVVAGAATAALVRALAHV